MSGRRFSAGIEAVLRAAAVDEDFERALLADRAAARERGIQLSDEELAALCAASDGQLRLFIEHTRRAPAPGPLPPTGGAGDDDRDWDGPVCGGIRPDRPPVRRDLTPSAPLTPPPDFVVAPQGIRPDVPPRRSWLDRLLRRK